MTNWCFSPETSQLGIRGHCPSHRFFRRLSEVVRKLVGAGLFAKIRLTNGRLAGYLGSLAVVCISEEVPAIFRYSKGRTDGRSREYVRPDYPKRVMEFGLCLSRLFEHRFYQAPTYTTGLLPQFLTDKSATLKWWIAATLGERDWAGRDKSN